MRRYVENIAADNYMLVHSTIAGLSEAIGIPVSNEKTYLLQRSREGWKEIRTWTKRRDQST